MHQGKVRAWALRHFGGAKLGDVRRVRRVITLAEALAGQPGKSIPRLFTRTYDMKAAYTLLKRPEANPDALQAGHRSAVHQALRSPGTYLLIDDDSTVSYAGMRPLPHLGPTGDSKHPGQGYLLHSTLAMVWPETLGPFGRRPPLAVVGLADQQFIVRPPKARQDRQERAWGNQDLETEVWERANERLGPAPNVPGVLWLRVADRAADIYEFLSSCREQGYGFVVRAKHDRNLQGGGKLFAFARALVAQGNFALRLRARPQHPARTAQLAVAFAPVKLAAPQRPGHGPGKLPPIPCTLVRVWEPNPPEGVEPLEWLLLVDGELETYAQARERALYYSARWVIEEFHKVFKTGLRVEELQLEDGERLQAAAAIMSIVALRLLDLKERLRLTPEAPATESGLDSLELELLAARLKRKLNTVRDVAMALGRLGGHLNRNSDGPPGWQSLWLGMAELQALVEGARLFAALRRSGQ